MPPETLRVWYQKHLDQDNLIKVLQASQEERIKQLERENNQLQRANEILRKAAAFSPRRSSTAHANNGGFYSQSQISIWCRVDLQHTPYRRFNLLSLLTCHHRLESINANEHRYGARRTRASASRSWYS